MANYIANGTESSPRHHKVRAFIDLHSYGQLCELLDAVVLPAFSWRPRPIKSGRGRAGCLTSAMAGWPDPGD